MTTVQDNIDSTRMVFELVPYVRQWAEDRNLIEGSTPSKQAHKTMSEIGELFDAIGVGNHDEIKDAIGDVMVTLIIVTAQLDKLTISPMCCDNLVDDSSRSSCVSLLRQSSNLFEIFENDVLCDKAYDVISRMINSLSHIAEIYDLTLGECLESAYNEIKDRKGRMVNGVFVKES